MIVRLKIYDEDIKELLTHIDGYCRRVDEAKYGLPKNNDEFNCLLSNIVYTWLYKHNNRNDIEKEVC